MYISLIEYYKIVVFFFVALCLIFIMLYLSKIFSLFFDKNRDLEKISAYECGFDPFNDARLKFEVQYFIIGILFIVFDLEIAFLFPWAIVISLLCFEELLVIFFFFLFLAFGFLYEWKEGALT